MSFDTDRLEKGTLKRRSVAPNRNNGRNRYDKHLDSSESLCQQNRCHVSGSVKLRRFLFISVLILRVVDFFNISQDISVNFKAIHPFCMFTLSGSDSVLGIFFCGSAILHSKYLFYVESCFSSCFSATRNDSLLKSCTFAIGSSPSSPVRTGRWVEKKSSLPLNHEKQRENGKWAEQSYSFINNETVLQPFCFSVLLFGKQICQQWSETHWNWEKPSSCVSLESAGLHTWAPRTPSSRHVSGCPGVREEQKEMQTVDYFLNCLQLGFMNEEPKFRNNK